MKMDWFVALMPIGITVIYYGVILFFLIILWKLYKTVINTQRTLEQLETKVDKIIEYMDTK